MEAALGMMMLFMLVMFALFICWIMALIQVIRGNFYDPNNKVVWLLILILLGPVGLILFWLIGKKQMR